MFLRFVTSDLDEESHQELGVFHAAGNLRDSGLLSEHDEETLQEIRDWFSDNLEKPARFMNAKTTSLPEAEEWDFVVQSFRARAYRQDTGDYRHT